jgi:tRNA-dihydrouridine synthase A
MLLAELERTLVNPDWRIPDPEDLVQSVVAYVRAQPPGRRLHSITRHMHGLMAGRDGARAWRRFLSEVAARPEALPETLLSGLPILKHGLAA